MLTKKPIFQSLLLSLLVLMLPARAEEPADDTYRLNPGDMLGIFVWNEESLTREVMVRPDGYISMPLAGHIRAGGHTPGEVEAELTRQLSKYLKDTPTITVSLQAIHGNRIFVLGKVNRPGEYPIIRPTDVMQALSVAGGLNAFAAEGDVVILRREADGSQQAIPFRYNRVKNGRDLDTNIILRAGDVVVVP